MDYQIFTFSFKFFMVLLTMLSSPLFSFVFFVTIYLFISYLFPIYCQLVFCCLTLYDHSQDHSKSRPANAQLGHSHHPPSPSWARSRSLFKTLWTQYFVKCNKTIKTHKNVFFFSFLLGHLPTTTTNCRNLNFSCSFWWTLTLSSENAASGQAAGGKFLNNILICASNQVAKCLNYKLLENLNLQFSEQILRPPLCQLSANPLLKWKLTFCKQLLIGGEMTLGHLVNCFTSSLSFI